MVWPYRYAYDIPLVTFILNMYGVCWLVLSFFFGISTIIIIFLNIEEGMAIYNIHAHNFLLGTLILNKYGFVSLTSTVLA